MRIAAACGKPDCATLPRPSGSSCAGLPFPRRSFRSLLPACNRRQGKRLPSDAPMFGYFLGEPRGVEVLRLCYQSGGAIASRQESEQQSQREFGLAPGTTPQTVARPETGCMIISLEWLFKFCADCQRDAVALFQGSADAVSIVGPLGRTSTVAYIPRDNQMPVALGPYYRAQLEHRAGPSGQRGSERRPCADQKSR